MAFSWYDIATTQAFTFTFTPNGPPRKFSFDQVLPPARQNPNRPFKRRRPLWDVDGGSSEGKKKRRLRLNLITSRLSRPFSAPATNIVDRGIAKVRGWAKGGRLDKSLLRKAAIMNRVRTQLDDAKAIARRKSEESCRQVVGLRQVRAQRPRHHEVPLPPSPLGLSNYDALDLEDEIFDDDEEGPRSTPTIYSDFSIMRPMSLTEGDEYDYLDELDGIPHEMPEERAPPPPPDEKIVQLFKGQERQK